MTPEIEKPTLYYNDSVSKMIIAFPRADNLFEIRLRVHNGYYHHAAKRHKTYKRAGVHCPDNLHGSDSNPYHNKWWRAKFIVTKSGRLRARSDGRNYTSAFCTDSNGDPMFSQYFPKDLHLTQECKIL